MRHVRDVYGRKSVVPHLRDELKIFKDTFKEYVNTEVLIFHDKDGNNIHRPWTYISDPVGFKAAIGAARGSTTLRTKFGLDSGQVL
jgi:hypothetical protein